TSMPPPDPRSSTRSPGESDATAVGFPQPRLAATAETGRSTASRASYRPAPKVTSTVLLDVPQQLESVVPSRTCSLLAPACTRVAAAAYRRRTCSRSSFSAMALLPSTVLDVTTMTHASIDVNACGRIARM